MSVEYDQNKSFDTEVSNLLNREDIEEFEQIRQQGVKVVAVTCVHTNAQSEEEEQGKGPPVKCLKVPPVYHLITGYHYAVIGDHYFLTHTDSVKKEAWIFNALMAIHVDRNKAGEIRLKTRKPDIQVYGHTVRHYGAFDGPIIDLRDALRSAAKAFAERQMPVA